MALATGETYAARAVASTIDEDVVYLPRICENESSVVGLCCLIYAVEFDSSDKVTEAQKALAR